MLSLVVELLDPKFLTTLFAAIAANSIARNLVS